MLQIVKSKTTLLRNVQNSNMTFIICKSGKCKSRLLYLRYEYNQPKP